MLKKFRRKIEDRRSSRNPFWKILVFGKDLAWEIYWSLIPLSIKHDIDIDGNVEYCLISFPGCGRTWLRVMIKKALQLHFGLNSKDIFDLLFREIAGENLNWTDESLPRTFVSHDGNSHWRSPAELIKSKEIYKNKKVILLVRDLRDVLVSSYFERSRRVALYDMKDFPPWLVKRVKPYQGTLHQYIHERIGGFETLLRFYNIWAKNRHIPKDFLLVRYEDMRRNPHDGLRRILNFMGLQSASSEVIDSAIKFASFANMRHMQENLEYNSHSRYYYFYFIPADRNDKESYKTRRGKVGGFVDYLDKKDIEYLNKRIKKSLSDFYGYARNSAAE